METIKTYLENMFLSMPDTPEVQKAKEELYQMMEDKYYELKAKGKTENESVGTVISEFGNMEEIMEELGLSDFSKGKEKEMFQGEKKRIVTLKEAVEYIEMIKSNSGKITLATILCIFSPITLIFLGGLSEEKGAFLSENAAGFIGIAALLILIAIAVSIFIFSGIQMEKYEFLKKEVFQLDAGTERYLKEQQEKMKTGFSTKICIGVVLCIFSVLPILFTAFFLEHYDMLAIIAVCILLLMIGISMIFFIPAGMHQETYKVLLQEGDYNKISKSKWMDAVASVYWCIVTAIYLGWSFWTMGWGYTWIIWPVTGVLYGAIAAICKIIRKDVS